MTDVIKLFEHPAYAKLKDKYQTWKDLYDGDHDVLRWSRYLWTHELEGLGTEDSNRIRSIRELRTRYCNLIEPVISRYTSLFFKDEPIISPEVDELFGDGIHDVTGTGKSLQTFLKEDVLSALLLYGRPIIFTDAYNSTAPNRDIEEKTGLSPTFEVLQPFSVKDWQIETQDPARKGKFRFLRCEYYLVEPRESARQEPTLTLYSKEMAFRNGTYSIDIYKAENEQTGATNWKLVSSQEFTGYPDLPVKSIEGEQSWIKDVAEQALKLYNLESARDNIQLYQAYQRIFISGVTNADQKKALAEFIISFLPENSAVHTIEPANTQSLDQNIERTVNNLFRIAFNQNRTVSGDSGSVESAETQQESKEQLTSLIISSIESLETLINAAIKDYAWFKNGDADFEGKIHLSKDLKVDDVTKQIEIYSALRDEINKVPLWRSETLKKFVEEQNLPEKEEILEALDNLPPPQNSNSLDIRTNLLSQINGRQTTTPEQNGIRNQAA